MKTSASVLELRRSGEGSIERPRVEVFERPFTAADLAVLPSDLPSGGVRYELDDGRLISIPPHDDAHAAVASNFIAALVAQGAHRGQGKARGSVGILLWVDPDRVVGADAAFICSASLPARRTPEGYLATLPDLVVEVVSRNDTAPQVQRKVEDYLTAGVRIVWVADPRQRTVAVHRRGQPVQVLRENDTLTVEELIPGFALSVSVALAE
jgi:Uma2 family endonuclease